MIPAADDGIRTPSVPPPFAALRKRYVPKGGTDNQTNMKTFALLSILFLMMAIAPLSGEEFSVPAFDYSLDLPDAWLPMDTADLSKIAFSDSSRTAVLQTLVFSADSFGNARDIFKFVRSSLKAEGEASPFAFSGRDALFSDLTFHTERFPARGYFVFIDGDQDRGHEFDYALLSFTPVSLYQDRHDSLLSALDSFAAGEQGRRSPGPVSQFFYPFPGEKKSPVDLTIGRRHYSGQLDKGELDATQVLVEREARVLAGKQENFNEAWRRYYKLIYRDNYERLAELAEFLESVYSFGEIPAHDSVGGLLSWIQGFHYYRTGTIADLTSPMATAYTAAGDCDSRALLFVILLHHMGIDAILLVSTEYAHSAVGVDVEGPGARITYGGKSYLFAEVTEEVDLGLVERSMADPEGWIPMPLKHDAYAQTSLLPAQP